MSLSSTVRTEIWNMSADDLDVLVDLIKSRRQNLDCQRCRSFTVGSKVRFKERKDSYHFTYGTVDRITPQGRVHLTTDHGRKWSMPGINVEAV